MVLKYWKHLLLLQLPQHLGHNGVVQEDSRLLLPGLLLVHRLLQTGQGGVDRALLAHIAAVDAGLRAGEAQDFMAHELAGGDGGGVFPAAGAAGDGELVGSALQVVHLELGLAAGAGQLHLSHGQGEETAVGHHTVAALGTDIADGAAFFLHGTPPFASDRETR